MESELFKIYPPEIEESHNIIISYASMSLKEDGLNKLLNHLYERKQFYLASKIAKDSRKDQIIDSAKNDILVKFNEWLLIFRKKCWQQPKATSFWKYNSINKDDLQLFKQFHHSILNLKIDAQKEFQWLIDENISEANTQIFKHSFYELFEHDDITYMEQCIKLQTDLDSELFIYTVIPISNNLLRQICFTENIYLINKESRERLKEFREKINKSDTQTSESLSVLLYINFILVRKFEIPEATKCTISKNLSLITDKYPPIDLFNLLKKFNYSFEEYNWSEKLNSIIRKIIIPSEIFKMNQGKLELVTTKYNDIINYTRRVEFWMPFSILHLENCSEEEAINRLDEILGITGEIEDLFKTVLPYFEAFNEFTVIEFDENSPDISQNGWDGNMYSYCKISNYNSVRIKKENIDFEISNLSNLAVFYPKWYFSGSCSYVLTYLSAYRYNREAIAAISNIDDVILEKIQQLEYRHSFAKLNLWMLETLIEKSTTPKKKWEPFLLYISQFLGLPIKKSRLLNNVESLPKFEALIKKHRFNSFQTFFENPRLQKDKLQKEAKAYSKLHDAFNKNETVHGTIKRGTKGGLFVDLYGKEAFLPGSQIDTKPVLDYDTYIGKNMEFKVVKINEESQNVVVSHRALVEAEYEAQKKQILASLEKGQIYEGIVKNIVGYGVFVDLGMFDGLIHISDLSWGRVTHPQEIVELNTQVKVVILDFDDAKEKIALGLKQLVQHPWEAMAGKLEVGVKISGKVRLIHDYGAVIEITPGVEGLLHITEISSNDNSLYNEQTNPNGKKVEEFLSVGETVEVIITSLDFEKRKMLLSKKQLISHEDIQKLKNKFNR